MEELVLHGVWMVPLIIGIVEVVKSVSGMPSKYAPLVAVALGVGLAAAIHQPDWVQVAVVGTALGLSSVGLYSGTKNVIQ